MASFDIAYAWMMDNEDPRRQYTNVPDVGGRAISGINSRVFPSQYAAILAASQPARAALVHNFYLQNFWNKNLSALLSDELVKRLFDASVNMGSGTAVGILRQAINDCGCGPIAVTPTWGIGVGVSIDHCDPIALVKAFIAARVAHYRAIVANHPEDAQYLTQWLARAGK